MTTVRRGAGSSARRPAGDLTFADVESLLGSSDLSSLSAIRNRALVALLAYGGLRVSPALSLRVGDFDASFEHVRVGARAGWQVELLEGAPEALAAWAGERRALALPEEGPFFCTIRGGALATSYVRESLSRLAKRCSLAGGVSAESLRRAHAIELRRRGWSLRRIQGQLGHASAATTRRYLQRAEHDSAVRARRTAGVGQRTAPKLPAGDVEPLLRAILGSEAKVAALLRPIHTREGLLADMHVVAVESVREEPGMGVGFDAWAGLRPGTSLQETRIAGVAAAEIMRACEDALRTGARRAIEASITVDGEIRHAAVELTPLGADAIIALAGAARRTDLPGSLAGVWTALWDESDTALLGLAGDLTVTRGNRAARTLLGTAWPDALGSRPPFAFLGGMTADEIRLASRSSVRPARISTGDATGERPVALRVFDLWPPAGVVRHVLAITAQDEPVGRDIDRGCFAAYQSVVEDSPEHIVRFDRDGNALHANRTFLVDHGLSGMGELAGWWSRHASRFGGLARAVDVVLRTGSQTACEVDTCVRNSTRTNEWLLNAQRGPDGAISNVVAFGRDVTTRVIEERRVRRELALQTALTRVSQRAAVAPRQASALLCDSAAGILTADVVVLVAFDAGDAGVVHGLSPAGEWAELPGALWRRAAASVQDSGAPTRVPDVWRAPEARLPSDPLQRLRDMVFASAPITVAGRTWGAMLAGSGRREFLVAWDESTIMALAEAAAGIVRSARTRSRAATEAALTRIALANGRADGVDHARTTLAREAAQLLDAEHGMLFTADGGEARVIAQWATGGTSHPVEIGDTVSVDGQCAAAQTLRSGATAIVDDLTAADDAHSRRLARAGLRSGLAAPLTDGGRRWGVLCVASTRSAAFDQDAHSTFTEFTRLAGRCLSNVHVTDGR